MAGNSKMIMSIGNCRYMLDRACEDNLCCQVWTASVGIYAIISDGNPQNDHDASK